MSHSGEHFYNVKWSSRKHILGPQSTALRIIGIQIPWSAVDPQRSLDREYSGAQTNTDTKYRLGDIAVIHGIEELSGGIQPAV